MTTWLRPDADETRSRPAKIPVRLTVVFACWILFCSTVLEQALAQSSTRKPRAEYQIDSVDTAGRITRPAPPSTRYVPPVHQAPAKRTALLPISPNLTREAGLSRQSHLLDPQFEDSVPGSSAQLKRVVRKQAAAEDPNLQSGPFLFAPTVGPEPPEPDDSAEYALDAPDLGSPPIGPKDGSGGRSLFWGERKPAIAPNYWIISSRKCAQSNSPCDADACTEYFYRGPSGRVESRSAAEFYQSLNPAIPVCFMIHGSLTEWEQNLREGHATYEWLTRAAPNTPFQLVLFTWPSERAVTLLPPIDFSVLGRRSSFNGLYLARVLSRMPVSTSVSIIGHSHGARLAVSALHLMGGGKGHGYRLAPQQQPGPRIRLILAAAALDHQWLDPGERYDRALQRTESLMNLRNQTDLPLMLYPFPMLLGHDSLGRAGFSWYDQYKLGTDYGKIRNVEVTFLLGIRHIWPRFHDHPEIAQAVAPYAFFQQDVPLRSTVMRQRNPGFWQSKSQERPASMLAQPGPNPKPLGQSTLARSSSRLSSPHPVKEDEEVSLEPGRATLAPSAIRTFPRSAKTRTP